MARLFVAKVAILLEARVARLFVAKVAILLVARVAIVVWPSRVQEGGTLFPLFPSGFSPPPPLIRVSAKGGGGGGQIKSWEPPPPTLNRLVRKQGPVHTFASSHISVIP